VDAAQAANARGTNGIILCANRRMGSGERVGSGGTNLS
jgi:hypothetical protein